MVDPIVNNDATGLNSETNVFIESHDSHNSHNSPSTVDADTFDIPKDSLTNTLYLGESIPFDFSRLESWQLFRIVTPVTLTYLFRAIIVFTQIILLRDSESERESSNYSTSAVLANIWFIMTSLFIERGIGGAVNIVCAKAYSANNHPLVAYYLQQSIIWTIVFSIPLAMSWFFIGAFLKFFDITEDADILSFATSLARLSLIGLLPRLLTSIIGRWLQVYNEVLAVMFITGFFTIINIPLTLFLIKGLQIPDFPVRWAGFGLAGGAIASSLTYILIFFGLWLYITPGMRIRYQWPGYSWEESMKMDRVKTFLLHNALFLGLGGCLEEWGIQLFLVFVTAKYRDDMTLLTYNTALFLCFLAPSLSYGSISASTIRISHFLGSGKPFLARHTSRLSIIFFTVTSIVIGLILIFTRFFASTFVDVKSSGLAEQAQCIIGFVTIFSFLYYWALAILNAQGRGMLVTIALVPCTWVVGILFVLLRNVNVNEIFGIGLLLILITIILCISAWKSNWVDLSKKALELAEVENIVIKSAAHPLIGINNTRLQVSIKENSPTSNNNDMLHESLLHSPVDQI